MVLLRLDLPLPLSEEVEISDAFGISCLKGQFTQMTKTYFPTYPSVVSSHEDIFGFTY